jgi:adenosylcobinamide-phosphate synthase
MNLLALLAALVVGYYRPASQPDWLGKPVGTAARWLEQNFNDERRRNGALAWLIAALLPAIAVGAAAIALTRLNPWLGALFSIGVLYPILRIGHLGQAPEVMAMHLRANKLDEARAALGSWQDMDTTGFTATQVARVGIESTLRHAHRELFAPMFWFFVLGPAGPAGALLYRLADLLQSAWADEEKFGTFARQAFDWLDWLPARFTAAGFAVVGDFEDAIYCWRTQASAWGNAAEGILLASGAGALGVRLGEPLPLDGTLVHRPELGLGDEPDADYLQSATGLVWRVLVVILGLMLLLTFAHWLGN